MPQRVPSVVAAAARGAQTRILNVGCGPETYGTDFVDLYPARPNVRRCDAAREALPFDGGSFDEVYSKNFLEHVPDQGFVLREMTRVVRPGGHVRVITDNAGWILYHLPLRRSNYLEHNSNEPRAGPGDRHYALFTPLHLSNLFREAGLETVQVKYHYYSARRAVRFLRPVLSFLGKTPLRNLVFPHLEIVGQRAPSAGRDGPAIAFQRQRIARDSQTFDEDLRRIREL